MPKTLETMLFILTDFIAMISAFFLWSRIRLTLGYFSESSMGGFFIISLILFVFWFLIFAFYGHYQFWFTKSRIDEFLNVTKTISIGIFLIFLLTFDLENDLSRPFQPSRLMILLYWFMMVTFVGSGRVLLRSIHRNMLERGIGHRNTLIVGWGKKAFGLFDMVQAAPALGYKILGFVCHLDNPEKAEHAGFPIIGSISTMHQTILAMDIQEILIALPRRSEKQLEEVIGQCDGTQVGIKIMPEHYDIMIGQVRTNQLYGFPLIEILPQLMPQWERLVKRLLDFLFAGTFSICFLPFGLIIAILIKLDSRGPVFYAQKRVGLNGKHFKVLKYRTMIQDAEKHSGPVWAGKEDPRITRIGRILRKLRLDEFPQLINVLAGHMAIVGPRPERPFFVEKLKSIYPLYTRRLRIRPGITGWAQVKGEYDTSIEQVKEKLEFDLYYLENMSLRMDLKILFHTIYIMLRGKGQ